MAPDGVEFCLIAFIDHPVARGRRTRRGSSFNRLEFDTASAAVLAQLDAAAPQHRRDHELLSEPDGSKWVGTETTSGDPASNLTLSQTRAEQHRRGDCESRHLSPSAWRRRGMANSTPRPATNPLRAVSVTARLICG